MGKFIQILLSGSETDFFVEIFLRTMIMFFLVILVLRILGRRGVRQLTVFEMAMVISLGSAAGDPMFQADLPIVYAAIVFITVVLLYKLVTWAVTRFTSVERLVEGYALLIVSEGRFHLKDDHKFSFSRMEFFSELRNLNVEHLGQVKEGVLEVDGTVSLLFYPPEKVKFGLPLFPSRYIEVSDSYMGGPLACMFCGNVVPKLPADKFCPRCSKNSWALAINDQRV